MLLPDLCRAPAAALPDYKAGLSLAQLLVLDTLREEMLRIPMSKFKPSCAFSPINPPLTTELPPPAAEFTGHEPRADIIPGKNTSPAASGCLVTPLARPGAGVQGAALGWGLIQAERLGLQRNWDSAPPSLQASGFSPCKDTDQSGTLTTFQTPGGA